MGFGSCEVIKDSKNKNDSNHKSSHLNCYIDVMFIKTMKFKINNCSLHGLSLVWMLSLIGWTQVECSHLPVSQWSFLQGALCLNVCDE